MLDIGEDEFEQLVESALASIPRELARVMRNVAIFIEDDCPPDGPVLLGLYEGIPLSERGDWYAGVQPDRITVFRLPILEYCHSRQQVVDEVRKTVVHEVGHHFGIDDARLHELGY